jgi:hypothetical protein
MLAACTRPARDEVRRASGEDMMGARARPLAVLRR